MSFTLDLMPDTLISRCKMSRDFTELGVCAEQENASKAVAGA